MKGIENKVLLFLSTLSFLVRFCEEMSYNLSACDGVTITAMEQTIGFLFILSHLPDAFLHTISSSVSLRLQCSDGCLVLLASQWF